MRIKSNGPVDMLVILTLLGLGARFLYQDQQPLKELPPMTPVETEQKNEPETIVLPEPEESEAPEPTEQAKAPELDQAANQDESPMVLPAESSMLTN